MPGAKDLSRSRRVRCAFCLYNFKKMQMMQDCPAPVRTPHKGKYSEAEIEKFVQDFHRDGFVVLPGLFDPNTLKVL